VFPSDSWAFLSGVYFFLEGYFYIYTVLQVILCTLSIGHTKASYYAVRILLAQLIKCEAIGRNQRKKLLENVFAQNKTILKKLDMLDTLLDAEPDSEAHRCVLLN